MEPLAFVRSPIISTEASWANGVAVYSEDTDGSKVTLRSARRMSATASATLRMCSGVVPQQPPTSESPNSLTNPDSASASSSGVSGYSAPLAPSTGSPAFGITDTGMRAWRDRWRRCSLISAGPVAQFRPIMSMPSGSTAVSAAPISLPSSIVPVVSTVTWAMTGMSPAELGHRAARSQYRGLELQQVLAGLDEDRVGAAIEHAQRRLGVGVADHRVLGVPERRQLGARAHRPEHVPAAIGGRHLVGDPARDRGRPSAKGHGSCRRCRSRRGWTGCSRRCWSRPRRRRPRSSCGGSAR